MCVVSESQFGFIILKLYLPPRNDFEIQSLKSAEARSKAEENSPGQTCKRDKRGRETLGKKGPKTTRGHCDTRARTVPWRRWSHSRQCFLSTGALERAPSRTRTLFRTRARRLRQLGRWAAPLRTLSHPLESQATTAAEPSHRSVHEISCRDPTYLQAWSHRLGVAG